MAEYKSPVSITITPASVVYAVVIVLAVWLLFYLKNLVLIVLTAIVLASSIEPGVQLLMKRRIARPFAVTLVYLIVLGFLFAVAYLMFPPLLNEAGSFFSSLPAYLDQYNIGNLLSNQFISTTEAVAGGAPSLTNTLIDLQKIFTSTGEGAFRAVSSVFGGVFSFFLILLLAFYFALQEAGIDDFLRIVSPVKHQAYVQSLWKRSQAKIGLWMQGQLLLSLIVGILTYLWLTILGVPYALLLAVFAAIAELVPVFGSIVAAVPAVIVAFTSGGPTTALFAAGGYLVINQLQGNLIYPLVVKKVIGVPPLLVILALIAGAQLAGFLGVLLSVPLAAALREFVSDLERAKMAAAAKDQNG